MIMCLLLNNQIDIQLFHVIRHQFHEAKLRTGPGCC